jgi:chromosome segregation ATPase
MMTLRFRRRIAVLAAVVVAAVAVAGAQSTVASPSNSTGSSPELLAEVRGLRADFQQVAKVSVRAQLLVARLQLQEQRINVVGGQLADVRRLIDVKESGQVPIAAQLKRFEEASRNGIIISEAEQRDVEMAIQPLKAQLALFQREEQQLHLQETELSNQLTTEQGRWVDFNSRLDELERLLPDPKR